MENALPGEATIPLKAMVLIAHDGEHGIRVDGDHGHRPCQQLLFSNCRQCSKPAGAGDKVLRNNMLLHSGFVNETAIRGHRSCYGTNCGCNPLWFVKDRFPLKEGNPTRAALGQTAHHRINFMMNLIAEQPFTAGTETMIAATASRPPSFFPCRNLVHLANDFSGSATQTCTILPVSIPPYRPTSLSVRDSWGLWNVIV